MGEIVITWRVKGVAEAEAALDRVKKACEPPELTESLGKGADVFKQAAKDTAPFDTGRLKDSIDKRLEDEKTFSICPSDDLIPIYAWVQEFGAHGHPYMTFKYKGGWRRVREIRGQHYMQRAFDEAKEQAAETTIRDIIQHMIS